MRLRMKFACATAFLLIRRRIAATRFLLMQTNQIESISRQQRPQNMKR